MSKGSTPYTPQSNGLAERHVGTILTAARAVLEQAKLPLIYWDHAVRHVAWCKNMVRHGKTGATPYGIVMSHPCWGLHHVRPFGCRMLYHPVTARLPPFDSRLREGVCLGHMTGGIYKILTETGILGTKHVHAFEDEFPSPSWIDNADVCSDSDGSGSAGTESTASSIELSTAKSSDDDSGPDHDIGNRDVESDTDDDAVDQLTYTPVQPSRHGEEESYEYPMVMKVMVMCCSPCDHKAYATSIVYNIPPRFYLSPYRLETNLVCLSL